MKNMMVILLTYFLFACSSTESVNSSTKSANSSTEIANSNIANSNAKDEAGYECVKYARTGSRVKKIFCTTALERELIKIETKRDLDRIRDHRVSL
jgi:hypothetical protein